MSITGETIEARLHLYHLEIHRFRCSFRHAGKGGELINHAADVTHLANDCVGALFKYLAVRVNLLAVLAFQAFRRKLDWRKRVLDFVGNTARNVGPGCVALG
jgi:hypothetical protein